MTFEVWIVIPSLWRPVKSFSLLCLFWKRSFCDRACMKNLSLMLNKCWSLVAQWRWAKYSKNSCVIFTEMNKIHRINLVYFFSCSISWALNVQILLQDRMTHCSKVLFLFQKQQGWSVSLQNQNLHPGIRLYFLW